MFLNGIERAQHILRCSAVAVGSRRPLAFVAARMRGPSPMPQDDDEKTNNDNGENKQQQRQKQATANENSCPSARLQAMQTPFRLALVPLLVLLCVPAAFAAAKTHTVTLGASRRVPYTPPEANPDNKSEA